MTKQHAKKHAHSIVFELIERYADMLGFEDDETGYTPEDLVKIEEAIREIQDYHYRYSTINHED